MQGSGKSYVLSLLQQIMEFKNESRKIAFTASTGVAACNIGGLTIHSWSGVGLGTDSLEALVARNSKNHRAKQRWKKTEILVIDEISMLTASVFDKISELGKRMRNNSQPFGGLQLVLCGDFFQLPPVGVGSGRNGYAFESRVWQDVFGGHMNNMVILEKVYRQANDDTFLNFLNQIRIGQVSREAMIAFEANVRATTLGKGMNLDTDDVVTKLCPTNREVDAINEAEFCALLSKSKSQSGTRSEVVQFLAVDSGMEPFVSQLRKGTKVPKQLDLLVGAQVMLLKNIATSAGLVNGARGHVVGFEENKNGTRASIRNFTRYPIVKFSVNIGGVWSQSEVLVKEEEWDLQSGEHVLATRTQIPLMLSWAISVHKSQGMTIPHLELSFSNMFEYGQAYVALSRATSLAGLRLTSFDPDCVKAHQKVRVFYSEIERRLVQVQNNMNSSNIETTIVELACMLKNNSSSSRPPCDSKDWISPLAHFKNPGSSSNIQGSIFSAALGSDGNHASSSSKKVVKLMTRPNRNSVVEADPSAWLENDEPSRCSVDLSAPTMLLKMDGDSASLAAKRSFCSMASSSAADSVYDWSFYNVDDDTSLGVPPITATVIASAPKEEHGVKRVQVDLTEEQRR